MTTTAALLEAIALIKTHIQHAETADELEHLERIIKKLEDMLDEVT